jgi:hypothetical protein
MYSCSAVWLQRNVMIDVRYRRKKSGEDEGIERREEEAACYLRDPPGDLLEPPLPSRR